MTTLIERGWMESDWMTGPWMAPLVTGSTGMQVSSSGLEPTAMQVNYTVYNTTNLRILCDFASRGVTGDNWTATSTETGDYDASNLNNDIVENIWRSTSAVTQILENDAQTPVTIDTLAILSHNFSRGATVRLQIGNDATFVTNAVNELLQWTEDNIYWISPDLPLELYQYTRVIIDDTNNSDGFISVGAIVFGSAEIFEGECIVDDIEYGFNDFTGVVKTEGFTNVSNSRSLKKTLGLGFSFLNSFRDNFKIMRNIFETYRTTHKCLWIPTPDVDDMEITAKFAIFAKLETIPTEKHKSPDNDIDYASFSIDLDESL